MMSYDVGNGGGPLGRPFCCRDIIVEHGPPATFFTDGNDPRTKEFLSQIL